MKANCSDAYTPQEHLGLSPLTKSLVSFFLEPLMMILLLQTVLRKILLL